MESNMTHTTAQHMRLVSEWWFEMEPTWFAWLHGDCWHGFML